LSYIGHAKDIGGPTQKMAGKPQEVFPPPLACAVHPTFGGGRLLHLAALGAARPRRFEDGRRNKLQHPRLDDLLDEARPRKEPGGAGSERSGRGGGS
jgi:hypothetical protein